MQQIEILVLYYSQSGHTQKLANYIAEGIEQTKDGIAKLRTVPKIKFATELTAEDSIPSSGDIYATKQDLQSLDGLVMGSPTRFGNMAASLKYFLDGLGGEWFNGTLTNKPASLFTSSSSLHGGQESTLLSMMVPLLHHGMIIHGLDYANPELTKTQTGGTPYGVTHYSGPDNDYKISEDEKKLAHAQGQKIVNIARALKTLRESS